MQLWETNPNALIPHVDVREKFAFWLMEANTALWDERTPEFGRDYYLKRTAGLKAYSAYEADHYLRVLNRHDPRTKLKDLEVWREDQFGECMFLEQINRTGAATLADDSYAWLFDAKRSRKDTSFFHRLAAHLDDNRSERSPNRNIRMYAWGYDRSAIPMEYCPDSYVELICFKLSQSKQWRDERGNQAPPSTASIEKWRKLLGLKTTRPHAAKWERTTSSFILLGENCVKHGIPLEVSLCGGIEKSGISIPQVSEPNN